MEAKSIPLWRSDVEVIAKMYALEQVQEDRIRMEEELQQKIKDLVAEYDARLAQLDTKRRAIVTGTLVPTEQEEEECKSNFADPTSPSPSVPKLKGIPNFWLKVLLNVQVFDNIIGLKDARVLKHLLDVRCINFKGDLRGFRLEFEFSENQYITNSVLTKEFYHSSKEDSSNRFAFIEDGHPDRMVGCQIDWKPKKKVKPISRRQQWWEEACQRFFDFFSVSTKESICDLSFDSDREQRVSDFSVGELMRDEVLPWAMDYFIGDRGLEKDDDDDERLEVEEEEEEEQEEPEGEDEEDDEEEDSVESDDEDDDEMEEDEDMDDGKDSDEHDEDEEVETEDESHSEPPTKKFKSDASRGEGAKMTN